MKLSIKDRIVFSNIFPATGSLVEQILVRDIVKKIQLNQKEIEAIKPRQEGDKTIWNENNLPDKEINFSNAELRFLKDQVAKLDERKGITQEMVNCCLLIKEAEESQEPVKE